MGKRTHELETIIEAINGEGFWGSENPKEVTTSFGNMTAIAKRLGVSRKTVWQWAKETKAIRDAIDEAKEMRKDFVEDRMIRRVMEGSDTMMIFFAKTQMKDRGFVERVEWTGADGGPIQVDPIVNKALQKAYGDNSED